MIQGVTLHLQETQWPHNCRRLVYSYRLCKYSVLCRVRASLWGQRGRRYKLRLRHRIRIVGHWVPSCHSSLCRLTTNRRSMYQSTQNPSIWYYTIATLPSPAVVVCCGSGASPPFLPAFEFFICRFIDKLDSPPCKNGEFVDSFDLLTTDPSLAKLVRHLMLSEDECIICFPASLVAIGHNSQSNQLTYLTHEYSRVTHECHWGQTTAFQSKTQQKLTRHEGDE